MRDGVHHDVREMVVDQAVDDLPAVPLAVHHPGRLEHPQVLADQRLGHAERADQLVHAALRLAQRQDDPDPYRGRQRPQQVAGCGQRSRGVLRREPGARPIRRVHLVLGALDVIGVVAARRHDSMVGVPVPSAAVLPVGRFVVCSDDAQFLARAGRALELNPPVTRPSPRPPVVL